MVKSRVEVKLAPAAIFRQLIDAINMASINCSMREQYKRNVSE